MEKFPILAETRYPQIHKYKDSMNCQFPLVGDSCERTLADDNFILYRIVQIIAWVISGSALILAAYFHREIVRRAGSVVLSRLDQQIVVFVSFSAFISIVRAIDPFAWGGIIPPHIYMGLLYLLCTCTGCAGYCAMITFAKITRSVTLEESKLEEKMFKMLNIKNTCDLICLIVLLSYPPALPYTTGVYYLIATIYYAGLHGLTLKVVMELLTVIESIHRDRHLDIIAKVSRYVKTYCVSGPLFWFYNLSIGAFWLTGGYNLIDSVYPSPQSINNPFWRVLYSLFLDIYVLNGVVYASGFMILLNHIFPKVPTFSRFAETMRPSKDESASENPFDKNAAGVEWNKMPYFVRFLSILSKAVGQ